MLMYLLSAISVVAIGWKVCKYLRLKWSLQQNMFF